MLVGPGMSQLTDQQRVGTALRRDRAAARLWVWLGVYLALASAQCTFPEYNYADRAPGDAGGEPATGGVGRGGATAGGSVAAAAAGAGAGAGAGASVPIGGTGGAVGEAGAGGNEPTGGAPECAAPQWPVELCASTCLRRYPDHCYDGQANQGEVDVDCGGDCQLCTREACTTGADCLSGSCEVGASGSACFAPLNIKFTAHELNAVVGSTTWSITVTNDEASGKQYVLRDLKVRYYFDRSGIVEPILVRATQSNLKLLNGEGSKLAASWSLQRVERLANSVYDAYVEVAFQQGGQLFPGDQIELYQQMVTGDPGRSTFDQRGNYSFTKDPDSPWLHVTVFYRDKLVWGLEPRPANPHACFVRGVNLNGPAVTIDGNAWESATSAVVTTTGSGVNQPTMPFPAVLGGATTMLDTATRLPAGTELNLPTSNGTYLVYLYAISPSSPSDAEASLLTVQGVAPDSSAAFRSQASNGEQPWARLGPYRVTVTNGKLTVGVTKGAINFAGVELWYPQ